MERLIYLSILIISVFTFIKCENDKDGNSSSKISYLTTYPGGCNTSDLKVGKVLPFSNEKDTVIISVKDDTLSLFVGINYVCCAPFATNTVIENDSVLIYISDTCNVVEHSCYCKCMCYYTWEFIFTKYRNNNYIYKIILNNPNEDGPVVFQEGITN